MRVFMIAALCAAFQSSLTAQVPDPELLRSAHGEPSGQFGYSVTVEGDWLAVASREFVLGFGTGHIALFHRDVSGDWERDALLRPSAATPQTVWTPSDVQLRNGRLVAVGGGITVWTLSTSGWVEEGFFGVDDQFALAGADYRYVATDGETILATIYSAFDAHVFFWERRGPSDWVKVATIRSSIFDGLAPGVNNPTSFGAGLHVDGDVAVIGQSGYGTPLQGRAHVFHRPYGVWLFDQTLDAPGPVDINQGHGYAIAGRDDVLFVSSEAGNLGPGADHIGSVFEYRRTDSAGWQVASQIRLTVEPGQFASHTAFGTALRYCGPTLLVGVLGLRGPQTSSGANTTGRGTVLAFDRCGDLWSQRTVMQTPAFWGLWGVGGRRRTDFDGETVVASNPNVGYLHPTGGYWMYRAGAVGVTPFSSLPLGSPCLEIGETFCSPVTSGIACACGMATEPGRGCPNSTGHGARLYCEGAFDQYQIDRVIVKNLPPGVPTLLLVGGPTPQALPAQTAGAGLTCIGQVHVRRIALADASGQARFDGTPAPPSQVLLAAPLEPFPVQAYYRDAQDPCGQRWNTSNGVLFTGGL